MNDPTPALPARTTSGWTGRVALLAALAALAATGVQWWLGADAGRAAAEARAADVARLQRRLATLEERVERGVSGLEDLAGVVGADATADNPLTARLAKAEEALQRLPGGGRARVLWQVEQAEYFMRIANAQENLAGDTAGALAALTLADEHLRDAGDPRLSAVRRLVADEMAALRAIPKVDTEGTVLRLAALARALPGVPLKQGAPAGFAPEPAPAEPGSGMDRAMAALRNALLSIVSVRRTDGPAPTLLTGESTELLVRSLDLELQIARLAVMRGEDAPYSDALAAVRAALDQYFDTAAPEGAAALAALDELAAVRLPRSLPDISGSLAELLRFKERELAP